MDSNNIFFYTVFGILILFSFFTVFAETSGLSLENSGNATSKSFIVDNNWEEEGVVKQDLKLDGDKIYVDKISTGVWTSNLRTGDQMDILNVSGVADPSDGTINYTLRFWDGNKTANPDKTINGNITTVEYDKRFIELDSYDFFEIELTLEETSNNNNEKPNVQSLRVDYIENLDRSSIGLGNQETRIVVLYVFLVSGIFGLISALKIKEN